MRELILKKLRSVGVEIEDWDEMASLSDHGLDSLATVLFISEMEKSLGKKVSVRNFKQSDFDHLNLVEAFFRSE